MATAVHEGEHGLDLRTRITRARLGVLLLILSDAALIAAMYASDGYLQILNVSRQFRPASDSPPSIGVGLILAAAAVVSALVYYWGFRQLQAGNMNSYRMGVLVAWIIALAALIAQLIALFSLRYPSPIHAYASLVLIMTAYHAIHLFITVVVGFLLLGRISRGRIAGQEYVAEVSGYWWYYVGVAAVTTWAMTSFVT
jgi:heme/copper-type cytochrome/quinol oxidase subunit 3